MHGVRAGDLPRAEQGDLQQVPRGALLHGGRGADEHVSGRQRVDRRRFELHCVSKTTRVLCVC